MFMTNNNQKIKRLYIPTSATYLVSFYAVYSYNLQKSDSYIILCTRYKHGQQMMYEPNAQNNSAIVRIQLGNDYVIRKKEYF